MIGAYPDEKGIWTGITHGFVLKIRQIGPDHLSLESQSDVILGLPAPEFVRYLFHAQAMDQKRDDALESLAMQDQPFGLAYQTLKGLRLIRLDPFECLITFILSQNNHFARILRSVDDISRHFGTRLIWGKSHFYTFPTLAQLTTPNPPQSEIFRHLGAGFRDRYLTETLKMLQNDLNGVSLASYFNALKEMDLKRAERSLMQFPGVGPKVAQCILLLSLDHLSAVPVDTHVLKMTRQMYAPDLHLAEVLPFYHRRFGDLSGLVQHYLFAYSRYLQNRSFRDLVDRFRG